MSHSLGTFETILLAELRTGLPPLFYTHLLDITDDWAFVLKLHSFFEGMLTKLLREKLVLPANHHETMTPRDSFVSRVHLAERLDVVEPDYHGFLLTLNRLRNDLTHNIRFIAFDLERYVDTQSESDFRRTALTLCAGLKNASLGEFLTILQSPKALLTASLADREFWEHLQSSLQHQHRTPRQRDIRTVREFCWNQAPKASMWYAGVWTLDLISLHFHFEGITDPSGVRCDSKLDAKIQDLLLDPAVLAYKRKVDGFWNDQMN